MTGYFPAARPLTQSDAESARALVLAALGITPYVDNALRLVNAAAIGDDGASGLVIERDGTTAALAVYRDVAGAMKVWQLDLLLTAARIDVREVGGALVDAIVSAARAAGIRLLMAEWPADAVLGASLTLLRSKEFRQEARIPDFFRENVALLFLRRNIAEQT